MATAVDEIGVVGRTPSAFVAALLSGIIPGLGQAFAGRWRRALAWLVPSLLLAVGALAVLLAAPRDRSDVLALLLQPEVLLTILVVDLAVLIYRVAAIVDAWWVAGRGRRRPAGRTGRALSLAGLALVIVAAGSVHGVVAVAGYEAFDLVSNVFGPTGQSGDEAILPDDPEPSPSPSPYPSPSPSPPLSPSPGSPGTIPPWRDPTASEPTPVPSPSPSPSPSPKPAVPKWARDGRLDVLLVGTDAGPDRWKLRTDTMILLSVDIRSGQAALFGIPRNLRNVPLPAESAAAFDCHCFPQILNGLWVWADGHPDQFPGGKNRGWRALAGAISTLTGARLDGLAVVDLNGFVDLVDLVGGLRIKVPEALVDTRYPKPDGSGLIEIRIAPGWHRFDGEMALAYARSRHQDSDYGRMHRQQQVLTALAAQLKPCRLIPEIPSLLPIVRRSLWTTLPAKDLPALLELAARVDARHIEQIAFTPSRYPSELRPSDIERIRHVVAHVFDGAAPDPSQAPLDILPDGC